MKAWGSWAQDAKDGHVYECLAGFGHGPLDKPTGRYMGDTTSIFVLEVYEYYMHTGNKTWAVSMWPGDMVDRFAVTDMTGLCLVV